MLLPPILSGERRERYAFKVAVGRDGEMNNKPEEVIFKREP